MIWHYTTIIALPQIVIDWRLRPMNVENDGAVPLLWFTTQDAAHGPIFVLATRRSATLHSRLQSRIDSNWWLRFGLPDGDRRFRHFVTSWKGFGIDQRVCDIGLRVYGEAISQWLVTPFDVPIDETVLQAYSDGAWRAVDIASAVALAEAELRFMERLSVQNHFSTAATRGGAA